MRTTDLRGIRQKILSGISYGSNSNLKIIANNRKLELILTSNKPLLHIESCRIIDEFIAHSHEFIATRYDQDSPRLLLFPQNLLSSIWS